MISRNIAFFPHCLFFTFFLLFCLLSPISMAENGAQEAPKISDLTHACYAHKCGFAIPSALNSTEKAEQIGLHCWTEKLEFFERVLGQTLAQTVRVETNRVLWRSLNNSTFVPSTDADFDKLAHDAVERILQLPGPPVRDEASDWDRKETIRLFHGFMPALYKDVKRLSEEILRERGNLQYQLVQSQSPASTGSSLSAQIAPPEKPLKIECPRGCEHRWTWWAWALAVSAVLNASLILGIGVMVFALEHRESRADHSASPAPGGGVSSVSSTETTTVRSVSGASSSAGTAGAGLRAEITARFRRRNGKTVDGKSDGAESTRNRDKNGVTASTSMITITNVGETTMRTTEF